MANTEQEGLAMGPEHTVDVSQIKLELERDTRDVSSLWNEAIKRYNGIAGVELQPKYESVEAMVAYSTDQMDKFHTFRHDQKKVDKLRSLFAANIDLITSGAQLLINAAAPAFPPATALGTAFTYLISVGISSSEQSPANA